MNERITSYKKAVRDFCSSYSALVKITHSKILHAGLKQEVERFLDCRKSLLAIKEEMGYTDALAFVQDANHFKGFALEDGELSGDICYAPDIIRPWIEGFPEVANNYQYEVGMLILTQATENKKCDNGRRG